MVVQWGMRDLLGPVSFSEGHDQVFLGRDLIQHRLISQKTTRSIDEEIRGIISRAYTRTSDLLRKHREALGILAEALIERETVDGKEVNDILGVSPGPATASA